MRGRKKGDAIPYKWTEADADQVAAKLREIVPDVINSPDLSGVSMAALREAIAVLPPERRRTVASTVMFRPTLLPALARLREQDAAEQSTAVDQDETEDAPESDGKRHLVRTTAVEWVLIAEAMHEQNPHFGYPYKEHLAGLGREEIHEAMRVALPSHRQRKAIFPSQCREHLIEAFKVVRARLDAEKAERDRAAELEKARIEAEALAAIAKAETPAPVPEPVADPLGNAVRTIFRAFGEEFARGAGLSLSSVESMLINVLAAAAPVVHAAPVTPPSPPPSVPEPDPAPSPSPSDPFEFQPPSSYSGPEGVKQRPPRIAVIGPQGTLSRELEQAFPDIDFVYIERGPKGIPEAVDGCDRIVAIANFFNEATKMAVKRTDKGKSKLIVVDGGVSKVKRVIHAFMSSRPANDALHH